MGPSVELRGDHIDLVGVEGTIEQAEIHDAWRPSESEAIGLGQSRKAVRALFKFISDSEAPLRRVLRGLAQRGQVQPARIVAANHHGECVFKTERRADGDAVTRRVEAADRIENGLGVAIKGCLRMAVSAVPVYST